MLLFPAPVAVVQFEGHAEVNQRILAEIDAVDWDTIHQAEGKRYADGHTFAEDTFINLKLVPSCEAVLNGFVDACDQFASHLHWDVVPGKTKLTSFWAHITAPGDRTAPHRHLSRHDTNHFSGVYYVSTPDDCGEISFSDDRLVRSYEPRIKNQATAPYSLAQAFQVREGLMIIFPSWLTHRVGVNRSSQRRVSLSFNANLCHNVMADG